MQLLFVAVAFRFCAGYGIGVWKGPLYREAFPDFQVNNWSSGQLVNCANTA